MRGPEGSPASRVLRPVVLMLFLATPAAAFGAQAPGLPEQFTEGVPRADEARTLEIDGPLSERLTVVYWPGGEGWAERVAGTLTSNGSLPALPGSVPTRATFYLAPDVAVWDGLTSGRIPEWGAGVAFPELDLAVIPLYEAPAGGLRSRDRTVLHEWAHLGLHEYLSGLRIPRWFDEGYAQRAAGGWDTAEAWRLRLALAGGGAPPLDSLTLGWPSGTSEAQLAYLLAGSAVEYLVRDSGDRGLAIFLERWRDTSNFEEAFRQTFGLTTGTFETRWIRYVERRYGWILFLSQTAIFWTIAGVALVVLWRWRAARDRARLARLRATEPSDKPAFWLPDGQDTPTRARLDNHDTTRNETD